MLKDKKWPPASVLGGSPAYIKLATLMTGKPQSLKDLARLAHIEYDMCELFIARLEGAGILERHPLAAKAEPSALLRQSVMNGVDCWE